MAQEKKLAKVTIIGDTKVGKTEMLHRLISLNSANQPFEFKTEHTDYVKDAIKKGKKKSDPMVYRLPHNTKIITPDAEELTLTANFGETIFFSNKLMHRSGLNRTNNKVRFAITAFYHRSDVLESDWF